MELRNLYKPAAILVGVYKIEEFLHVCCYFDLVTVIAPHCIEILLVLCFKCHYILTGQKIDGNTYDILELGYP